MSGCAAADVWIAGLITLAFLSLIGFMVKKFRG